MTSPVRRIDAATLNAQLHDGAEIALLDAREEVTFGRRHLLMASCVPLSRLELRLDDLVPRRDARMVWCDDGEGLAARAAERARSFGYTDVAVLDGGIAAWEAAGHRLYSGVHVPSKAFAEVVEHETGTPWIDADELHRLRQSGADIVVFDSRSYPEYHTNSLPDAISVPGAELVYRFADLVPSPDTMIVINCGGRTRSIIGAQSLINANVPNKVVSFKNGTMAWHLAGHEVVRGATRRPPEVSPDGLEAARTAAARVAERYGVRRIDAATLAAWRSEAESRSLYLLDVRTPEEYEAGHLPGARPAPGGQLVQETDAHIGTWGARVVLVDEDAVRAIMTASWMQQMGWTDVAVLAMDEADVPLVRGPHRPRVLGLAEAQAPEIGVAALREGLAAGTARVVDLAVSKAYRAGHIPGAWFAIRSRLPADLSALPPCETMVLTSPDGDLARLAAAEMQGAVDAEVVALSGGTAAWTAAGGDLAEGPEHMASAAEDVWLPARERDSGREDAMREYLAWEIELVNQMATDDDQRFAIVTT